VISISYILIITGESSYPLIIEIVKTIKKPAIDVIKAKISISAFLSEKMVSDILGHIDSTSYDLILLPGFVQWDSSNLEHQFGVKVRKGPEFASDIPFIIKMLKTIELSNIISADKLIQLSGYEEFKNILSDLKKKLSKRISPLNFYINAQKSDLMIGEGLPPPIIAEIVNCTKKDDDKILKKVDHYLKSGADIIDIGCISNGPAPNRVKKVINLIRNEFNTLLSIDSMDKKEIQAAIDEDIDMILSLDLGNYEYFLDMPKDKAVVILPTNMNNAYFPSDPPTRVKNLFRLTKTLRDKGFEKLIADPLLETPIVPGIVHSLESYTLYNKEASKKMNQDFKRPLFFGISNVVELMDVDSVGINGLLASIAIELGIGILFTTEHSAKLTGGVSELKDSIKLSFLSKLKLTPPINQGITIFKAKGKKSDDMPMIEKKNALIITEKIKTFNPDQSGYFKFHVDFYSKEIYALFYSNEHQLLNTFIGYDAESLCKKIIEMGVIKDPTHINYLGRELRKAEIYLMMGKPYVQDE
jgi:dihydropteroate synthase-like protein